MGRERQFGMMDIIVTEERQNMFSSLSKTPFTKTIRVYAKEGENKILKYKDNFTANNKNYMDVFNNLKVMYQNTGYILELLKVGGDKINVLESCVL